MGRLRWCVGAVALVWAAQASAAERRATVQGLSDRTLRAVVERALGEEKKPAANRMEARRRARKAAQEVTAALRSDGYYDAVVEPDVGDGPKPQPLVKVTAGPRTLLAQPKIAWVGSAPDASAQAAAQAALALRPGAPGRAAEVIAAEGRVIAALEQAGYADAAAQPREVVVDHADRTMTPTYNIASGALVRLDGLDIKALGRTDARWLRSLTPWKRGQVYRPDSVAELERRLLDTQVYDSVTVALAPAPGPDGLRPVVVSLADRARHTLEFSAGYSTTEGADLDVRWLTYNQYARGDTLAYEARIANIDSRIGVDWTLPNWRRPGLILKPSAQLFRTETDAYTDTGAQVALDLTQRYGKTSYFTRGVSLTASNVRDKETGTLNIGIGRVLGALVLDRSDNPLDPRRGYKLSVRGEPTVIVGDEQLVYLKAQAQGSVYLPLDLQANTVVAGRLHVGSILGGSIPQVPASDRFYAGGGGSVRGYDYQSVGPHYADTKPVGGLALVETSIELRHRFTEALGGVLFIDSGSVSKNETPDISHVYSGVGVGLRYNLGFAPVRIDLATPLQNPGGAKQSAFQIYLSIGQSF